MTEKRITQSQYKELSKLTGVPVKRLMEIDLDEEKIHTLFNKKSRGRTPFLVTERVASVSMFGTFIAGCFYDSMFLWGTLGAMVVDSVATAGRFSIAKKFNTKIKDEVAAPELEKQKAHLRKNDPKRKYMK